MPVALYSAGRKVSAAHEFQSACGIAWHTRKSTSAAACGVVAAVAPMHRVPVLSAQYTYRQHKGASTVYMQWVAPGCGSDSVRVTTARSCAMGRNVLLALYTYRQHKGASTEYRKRVATGCGSDSVRVSAARSCVMGRKETHARATRESRRHKRVWAVLPEASTPPS